MTGLSPYPKATCSNETSPLTSKMRVPGFGSGISSGSSRISKILFIPANAACICAESWATCERGSLHCQIYRMKAWRLPTVSIPCMTKTVPDTATPPIHRYTDREISGLIMEETNCAFRACFWSLPLISLNRSWEDCCLPNSRISLYPVYSSVIVPFSSPRESCCALKCFWLFLTTATLIRILTGMISTTSHAITG